MFLRQVVMTCHGVEAGEALRCIGLLFSWIHGCCRSGFLSRMGHQEVLDLRETSDCFGEVGQHSHTFSRTPYLLALTLFSRPVHTPLSPP